MEEYGRFYEESLYPLQDGVLRRLQGIGSPFYLTGGTALGRGLIGHRYSDDLDLFTNENPDYRFLVQDAVAALTGEGGITGASLAGDSILFDDRYSRILLQAGGVDLKIDFVNDIAFRVGVPRPGAFYDKIDSVENILSNKISALYRYEAKDIADIWAIARRFSFSWGDIIAAAKEKDAGVDSGDAAEIVLGFPPRLFDDIKWRTRPEPEGFLADLRAIARGMLELSINEPRGQD